MSIFSTIKSAAQKVVKNVSVGAKALGSAIAGGAKTLASNAQVSNTQLLASIGAKSPSPAQQAAQQTSGKTGPGISYTPVPTTLKSGVGVIKNTSPSGTIMSQAAFDGLQAAKRLSSGASGSYTPVNTYGGLTPTTLSSGQKMSSSPAVSSTGEVDSFTSFRPMSSNPAFSSINTASISAPAASVSLPSAPAYANPGSINNGGLVNALSETKQYDPATGMFLDIPQDPQQAEANKRNGELKSLLDLIPKKDSVADDPQVQQQEAEVRAKRQELNNYTGQLNSIVAKQNADLLTLRGIGGAEGVTEAVYGGQAATINREAAIRALPIQAQISAAQGNLELAQDYLTDLKKIKQDTIDADFTYNMKKFESIAGFVTGEQKIRLDNLRQTETRAHETTKQNLEDQDAWAREVAKVKPSLIAKIQALNPASPTFRQDLGTIVSQLPTTSSTGGVASPYANDLDAIVGATISSIPTKFGQETFQAQMNRARNDSDKINLVATQVLKGQPSELKLDFANQASGIANIDKAIAVLDEGTKTGVLQSGLQYAYNLAGKDFDPKLAKINAYLTSAIQPYRNSVTGAAWGDQEESEYASLFGSTKFSPVELRQRLVQVKEVLKNKSATGLNAFVNPLGLYGNEFETGNLTPSTGGAKSIDYTATLDSIFN